MRIYWTIEEENKLKNHINQNISFKEMSNHFPNRTSVSLQKKSIKMGLMHKFCPQKYSIDLNYFNIPTLTNCYIMGNFAADGYMRERYSNIYSFTWQVNTKDVSILEMVKKETKYTGNIRSYQRKNYQKETYKNVSYINITCAHKWAEDFKKNFGIVPNKTLRMNPPNLGNKLLNFAYIIGYIDGDGCIRYDKNRKNSTLRFYSCNYKILEWIKQIIDNLSIELGWNNNEQNILKSKCKNLYSYNLYDIKACVVIDYLRKFPVPKLDRKWNNPEILSKIEEYKQKYPQYFNLPIPDFIPYLPK